MVILDPKSHSIFISTIFFFNKVGFSQKYKFLICFFVFLLSSCKTCFCCRLVWWHGISCTSHVSHVESLNSVETRLALNSLRSNIKPILVASGIEAHEAGRSISQIASGILEEHISSSTMTSVIPQLICNVGVMPRI